MAGEISLNVTHMTSENSKNNNETTTNSINNNNNSNNETTTYASKATNFRQNHSNSLMQGLNTLRRSKKLFDVTLIVEGIPYQAHRVVLAACSDYFCAMFTDAMLESRQSEIELHGINSRGFHYLLEYVYTSKLELDQKNVEDVLSVATHVQMSAVIEACSNFLESQIDLNNCVAVAELSEMYSLLPLRKKTYRFMCSCLVDFAQTPDFYNLSFDQFLYFLSCNYPVDCTEDRVLNITLDYCTHVELQPKLASRLFEKIRFEQFNGSALNELKCRINANLGAAAQFKQESIYYKVLQEELIKFEQARSQANGIVDVIPHDVLINSRGMELALIKIGGFEKIGLTNQISCFLASKRIWKNLTVIPHIEQCNYGTAVLGNDLFIVAGSYDICLKEYIHPFGFRYCPTKNKWRTIAPIQADRCRFSLNAMGANYLYAVGGVCELNDHDSMSDMWGNEVPTSNCERYDATTDHWDYIPPLVENRSQHAGVVIGNLLYVSGGIDRHIILSSLWCFNAETNLWMKLCSMPTPRADHVLLEFDGFIYACGGWYEDSSTEMRVLADTIDVYDPATDQWMVETRNLSPKFYAGITLVKRKIYFIGGLLSTATINRATSAVHCYDLDSKEWTYSQPFEYTKEVWECTCAALYVPTEGEDFKPYWWDINDCATTID